MKKLVIAAAMVLATAIVATAAYASGPVSDESGIGCNVIDRGGATVFTTDSRLIHYASGKVTLRCIGQGTPGATIETTTGFVCGLAQFGLTTDSSNRVGKNGEIQLSCTGFAEVSPDAARAASAGAGAQ
jgi:hypothetical protein